MSEAVTRKIAPHPLEREACLYVRQPSLRQVAENTESARRQYGLSRKAMALGWPTECIRVIEHQAQGRLTYVQAGLAAQVARGRLADGQRSCRLRFHDGP